MAVLDHLKLNTVAEDGAFYLALIYLPTLRKYPIDQRAVHALAVGERLKLSRDQQNLFAYLLAYF